jgi:ABC-type sugar transport system permease subunit
VSEPRKPSVRRPILTYTVGTVLALLVTLTVFVIHRNREYQAAELDRGARAVRLVAEGKAPITPVIASGILESAHTSTKYPFLRRIQLRGDGGRTLGGLNAPPEDKILYDAAIWVETDLAEGAKLAAEGKPDPRARQRGHLGRFLADGSQRIVSAVPAKGGVAVVLARPLESPAPFPILVLGGLIIAGALAVYLGARQGRVAADATLLVGMSILAVPAALWGGTFPTILIVLFAGLLTFADDRGRVRSAFTALREHRVAYTYILPAAFGMGVLVLAPLVVGIAIGFYDHSNGEWHYVGLKNFIAILSGDGRPLTDPLNFWFTFAVTVAWTALNVTLHVTIGVILALALREPWIKTRGVFRAMLILPWAVPNYITAYIWRGMFQKQFGAINALLKWLGLSGDTAWFSQFSTSFTANVVTNTWLGFPFMMVVALGALESIPRDLYEAAAVDGASRWQRFTQITLPNLRPALGPAVILGCIWTFNAFNVIYLVSGGKPVGATDILITQAYRWAFERGQRYGMAAAYATIIFLILLGWTLLSNRLARKREAD